MHMRDKTVIGIPTVVCGFWGERTDLRRSSRWLMIRTSIDDLDLFSIATIGIPIVLSIYTPILGIPTLARGKHASARAVFFSKIR